MTDAAVFNRSGDCIGHIDNLSIAKVFGEVIYAPLSFGGFLGHRDKLLRCLWAD